jgi:hypothetical protein
VDLPDQVTQFPGVESGPFRRAVAQSWCAQLSAPSAFTRLLSVFPSDFPSDFPSVFPFVFPFVFPSDFQGCELLLVECV